MEEVDYAMGGEWWVWARMGWSGCVDVVSGSEGRVRGRVWCWRMVVVAGVWVLVW